MKLVFLGPPGAGKGTQASRLANDLKIAHLSTGDMLRQAIKDKTPVGLEAQGFIDAGELVPDEVVIGIIAARISEADCVRGFILDGFPRNLAQAHALADMLTEKKMPLDAVIEFKVDQTKLLERIFTRAQEMLSEGGQERSDDTSEVFKTRLEIYETQTAPISAYYEDKGLLKPIDGMQSIETVSKQIHAIVKEIAA